MGVKLALCFIGHAINEIISFLVFSFLDLFDVFLCLVYKLADYAMESEWKPCYCSSSAKDIVTNAGKILLSDNSGSRIIYLCSSSKLQLEDISDTLYSRPSLVSDVCRNTVQEFKKMRIAGRSIMQQSSTTTTTTYSINSTIMQMLQGRIGGKALHPMSRWSDCDCRSCTSWWRFENGPRRSLFVHVEMPKDGLTIPKEDVLFIHGFISSSAFWTETVFPHFSDLTNSKYRLLAIDLLGFGQSPKPADSLYTLREHVDAIESSVIKKHNVKSFHIVAHSLGSILALALAVQYPHAIKSLTLLAPPYFPVPKGEQATQYMLRRVAPRRVWPLISFGASLACWYEHVSRTICLLICRNHRIWEFLFKFITRNRVKTFLLEGFFCHTHNAAWHTLHNIICGSAGKIDKYLDTIRDRLKCNVNVIHGRNDEVLPVECSIAVKSRIPRANLKIIDDKDHITVIIGRQKAFAEELEKMWAAAEHF